MPRYYLSHIGGLEDVVDGELREKLPEATLLPGQFGRRYLEYEGPPERLLSLRTVENVFLYVLELPVRPGRDWLDELESTMAGADLALAVAVLRQVRGFSGSPSFRVSAERLGRHEFQSPEIAGAAGAGIVTATGWRVDLRGFDVEVQVEVCEDHALVGVRVSATALHKRSRVIHPRVTLNPTIAAAMVRLSEPTPGQVVLDPMCGGGTIIVERHDYDPKVMLLAGDYFPEKVAMARANLAALEVPAHLLQWDATRLPLGDETVDRVICNPPWGNLVANKQANRRLYPWLLGHLRRCLKPGGLMVLLTSERRLVQRFVDKSPDIRQLSARRLSVSSLHPTLYVLRKVKSPDVANTAP